MRTLPRAAVCALSLTFLVVPALAADGATEPTSRPPSAPPPALSDEDRERLEREARRRDTPEAREERRAAPTAFSGLPADRALSLARSRFPRFVETPPFRGPRLREGDRIVRYLGENSAYVEREGVKGGTMIESTLPLRAVDEQGRKAPVDLSLLDAGAWLEPRTPLVSVRLPKRLSDGIRLDDAGVAIRPIGEPVAAQEVEGKAFYASSDVDTDFIAFPVPAGVESMLQLRSVDSPERHRLALSLPAGARLQAGGAGQPIRVVRDGETLGTITPPVAVDADGHPVPASFDAQGTTIELRVDHRERDVAYPVLVDPTYYADQRYWHRTDLPVSGHARRPYGDMEGWTYTENDPWGLVSPSGWTGDGGGLHVTLADWAYTGNWGEWLFQAPGDTWIWRVETYTAHESWWSTLFHGLYSYPNWQWTHLYDSNGTRWTSVAPAEFSYTLGLTYWTHCAGNNPCSPYNANMTPASPANNLVAIGIRRHADQFRWADAWAAGVFTSIQDDTAPTIGITGNTTPAGWTDDASPTVSASANDAGMGVFQFILYRRGTAGYLALDPKPCSRPRPQHCWPDSSGGFTYSTSGLAEGRYTYAITAQDAVGNESAAREWPVKIDRSRPTISGYGGTLYDARNGAATASSHTLQVRADDGGAGAPRSGVASVEYRLKRGTTVVRSGTATNTCSPTEGCSASYSPTFTIDTASLADGSYDVEVTVKDQLAGGPRPADHTLTTKAFDVVVDRQPPAVASVAHSPDLSRWYRDGAAIATTVTGTDAGTGIKAFEVRFPQGPASTQTRDCGTAAARCAASDSQLMGYAVAAERFPQDGASAVAAVVRDAAGRESAPATWNVKVDRGGPAVQVTGGLRDQPRSGRDLRVVATDGDAIAPRSGVRRIEVLIDRDEDGDFEPDEREAVREQDCVADSCSLDLDYNLPADYPEGTHLARVLVTDQAGNTSTHDWSLAVAYAPAIASVDHDPQLGAWHRDASALSATVNATDQGKGLKSFELALPGGGAIVRTRGCGAGASPCAAADSETFSYSTDVVGFPQEGVSEVSASVADAMGNRSPASTWPVKVDRGAPTAQVFGALRSNLPTGRDLHVRASDGDLFTRRSGVRRIELTIDRDGNGELEADEVEAQQEQGCPQDSCSMELDYTLPSDYPAGRHLARVAVTDHAGNVSTDAWALDVVHLLTSSRARLGLEDFFDYESLDAGGDSRAHVNAETGNVVWHTVPIVNPGRGLSTVVNLTYNSLDRGGMLGADLGRVPLVDTGGEDVSKDLPGLSYAEAGVGFSISVSGPTRINEPLGGVELAEKKEELTSAEFRDYVTDQLGLDPDTAGPLGDEIAMTDADGTLHTFRRGEDGRWRHPAGVTMHLRRYDPALATRLTLVERKWAMTRPDGVTHFFDNLGYLTETRDRNDNVLRYEYRNYNVLDGRPCTATDPIAQRVEASVYCVRRLARVVDPAGVDAGATPPASSVLEIAYREGGLLTGELPVDAPLPFPGLVGGRAGRISQIVDHAGRAYRFEYDDAGYLVQLTEAADVAEPRVTRLEYEPRTTVGEAVGEDRQLTAVVDVRGGSEHARTAISYPTHAESPPAAGALRLPRRARRLVSRTGFRRDLAYAANADGTRELTVVAAVEQDAAGAPTRTTSTLHRVDTQGRPIAIVDGLGRTSRLDWTSDNRVEEVVEAADTPDEARTEMTYTANGLLDTRTTHPTPDTSRTVNLDYADGGGVHRSSVPGIDDAGGSFVSDLRAIENAKAGTGYTFRHDARGNVEARVDARGNEATTTYDARGRITSERDEVGHRTDYEAFHATGEPRVVVDPKGTRTGEREAHRWIYRYDALGNVTAVTDPRGAAGGSIDDERTAFTTTLAYDAFDRLLSERTSKLSADEEFVTRSRAYDRNGNVVSATDGEGATTTIAYTKSDLPQRVDAPGSHGVESTTYAYDGLDRLVRRSDPSTADAPDSRTDYQLDAAGQRVAEIRAAASGSPDPLITSFAYDARGNLAGIVDPRRNHGRSAAEAAEAAKSPSQRRVSYAHDRIDQVVAEEERPASEDSATATVRTEYEYDANGNRTAVVHPRSFAPGAERIATTVEYDHRDQPVKVTGPDGKSRAYTRREDGKVVAETSGRGVEEEDVESFDDPLTGRSYSAFKYFTTRYAYDEAGDVASRSVPYGPGQYELPDSTLRDWKVRYTRDAVGNPTRIVDARGNEIVNTFFDSGELRSTTRPSFYELDWGHEEAFETPDPGLRFRARDDLDAELGTGGPRLVERQGRSANAQESEESAELPSSEGQGNFASVDAEELPGLLPRAGTTTFDYDDEMRFTGATVASRRRSISYDPAGRVRSKTWPYDADTSIVHRFDYDAHGNLTELVDGAGAATTFGYDAFDRRVREEAPGAGATDAATAAREVTTYSYDLNGNLTGRDTPRAGLDPFAYDHDSLDRLVSETNPAGERWSYRLDRAGNRTMERSPRGHAAGATASDFETTVEFDPADRVKRVVDAAGQATTYEYDADGNRERVEAPGAKASPGGSVQARVTQLEHDAHGSVWKQTLGTGSSTRTTLRTFDANGNLRRVVNPKGVGDAAARDDGSNGAANLQDATKHATVRLYDENDLLTEVRLPWGTRDAADRKRHAQTFVRDSRGRVSSMFAAHELGAQSAAQTSYTHFDTDWIASSSDEELADPASTQRVRRHLVDYEYDARGNQTLWRTANADTPRGRVVRRTFWPNGTLKTRVGRKVTEDGEDDTTTRTYRYGYNANRSLVWMKDDRVAADGADDHVTTFSRDAAEREEVVNETWASGKDTRFAYDANGNVTLRQTDGRWVGGAYQDSDSGRDDAKVTRFEFDRLDREVEMRVDHGDDPLRTTTRSYHPSGELAAKTQPNGVVEERYFSALGEPALMRRRRGSDSAWGLKDQSYDYDANGNRTRDERGQHEFNARDQLVRWTRGAKQRKPGTTVTYELTPTGAVARKTDSGETATRQVTTYTYDGTRLSKTEDGESESAYSYDDFGNVIKIQARLKVGGTVFPPLPELPALPEQCRPLDVDQGTTRYCYDEFERLLVAKGPGLDKDPAVFEYDGFDRKDRRIVKTATGDRSRDLAYVGTSRLLSRERDGDGQTKYYDYDSDGVRQGQGVATATSTNPSTFRAYGLDANGSVEELEEADGSVPAGARYVYDPYGELDATEESLSSAAQNNPFRYEGFYYESGVKTYDMQARHYRPDVGRFLTQDRYESARGDLNLQSDPLTQNRYVFGGANPVNNVEFDGHFHCAAALRGCHSGNVFEDDTRGHARGRAIRGRGGPGPGLSTRRAGGMTTAGVSAGVRATAGRVDRRIAPRTLAQLQLQAHVIRTTASGTTPQISSVPPVTGLREPGVEPMDLDGDLLLAPFTGGRSLVRPALSLIGRGTASGASWGLSKLRGLLPRGGSGAKRGIRPDQIHGVDEALTRAEQRRPKLKGDGKVFENRDGILPGRPDGSYTEWAVPTPRRSGRGVRRLIVDQTDGRAYYTWNHYDSFVELRRNAK
jgi:RHS repeat-associated protein